MLKKKDNIASKKLLQKSHNYVFKTWNRSLMIEDNFVGHRFKIYNGKEFTSIDVTSEMLGHKVGEFAPTRMRYEFKKKRKKK